MTSRKYVKVPSDILQALARVPLSEYEARAVCFLLTKSEQEWTCLTLSDWSCAVGISKQNMNRTLKRLVQQNIVKRSVVSGDYSKAAKYGFNRHFERWQSYSQETTDHANEVSEEQKRAEDVEQNNRLPTCPVNTKLDNSVVSGDYCEPEKVDENSEKATSELNLKKTTHDNSVV